MKGGHHGFTLLEALVALLVVSFGALALVRLQLTAELSQERTQHRGDAWRLADQQLERLRARVPWLPTTGADVPETGKDQIGTFNRSWSVATPDGETLQLARIQMDWTDRFGGVQTLSVNTVIGPPDPVSLPRPSPSSPSALPPTPSLQPFITQPWGDGRQRLVLTEQLALVFSPDPLQPPRICPLASVGASPTWTHCEVFRGLMLTGYITRHTSAVNRPWPTGLDTTHVSGLDPDGAFTCRMAEGFGQLVYLCIVTGVSAEGWSGRVQLAGLEPGTGLSVCRFEHDKGPALMDDNQRHVQPYRAVRQSLMHQNYLLYADPSATGTCPDDVKLPTGVRLVAHPQCSVTPGNDPAACP